MRAIGWQDYKTGIGYCEQSAWFTAERKNNQWFAAINFSSAQDTMRRLDKAFKAFFRRVKSGEKPGYPRFKSWDRFDSFCFPSYGDGIKRIENKLRIQNVGLVKVKFHRETEGAVKTVSIKREAGKWFAVFSCELPDVPVLNSVNPPVGIDVGIESFLTTSEGQHVPNPRLLKDALPALRREQRALSRKRRGGKNRRKQARRVAKLHGVIGNKRRDFHHKEALNLVRRHGLVAVEDLNILGMSKNHRLARAIQDVAWGNFLNILDYKAASAGVRFVRVNARNTSQECSGCGQKVPKALGDRWHHCSCGLSLHRDHNAAKVILGRALNSLARTEPVSANAAAHKAAC
jgi:putative transposase